MKIKDLAQIIGLAAALSTPFPSVDTAENVGFKKSTIPAKDYAKRKRG